MEITALLTALAVGLIIGALGRLVARGSQNVPIWLTLLAGVIAAALGSVVATVVDLAGTRGTDGFGLVIQIALAAAGVGAVAATTDPRKGGHLIQEPAEHRQRLRAAEEIGPESDLEL